jgi:hypothetical protein
MVETALRVTQTDAENLCSRYVEPKRTQVYACKIQKTANGCGGSSLCKTGRTVEVLVAWCLRANGGVNDREPTRKICLSKTEESSEKEKIEHHEKRLRGRTFSYAVRFDAPSGLHRSSQLTAARPTQKPKNLRRGG